MWGVQAVSMSKTHASKAILLRVVYSYSSGSGVQSIEEPWPAEREHQTHGNFMKEDSGENSSEDDRKAEARVERTHLQRGLVEARRD